MHPRTDTRLSTGGTGFTANTEKFDLARWALTRCTAACGVHTVGVDTAANLARIARAFHNAVVRRAEFAIAVAAQTTLPVLYARVSETFGAASFHATLRSV